MSIPDQDLCPLLFEGYKSHRIRIRNTVRNLGKKNISGMHRHILQKNCVLAEHVLKSVHSERMLKLLSAKKCKKLVSLVKFFFFTFPNSSTQIAFYGGKISESKFSYLRYHK
jgi:hypothetical protein